MEIISATVIECQHTADIVVLHTNLPSPMPHVTKEPNSLMFYTEYDKGEEYVKTNFPGIPIEIVPRMKITVLS